MSGDSTNECDSHLRSGSSGWSILKEPAAFDSVPLTCALPCANTAYDVDALDFAKTA